MLIIFSWYFHSNIRNNNWRKCYMNDKEKVKQIVEKYNKSIAELSEKATAKEFKFVMSYIAQEANRRQRELVGMKD